MVKVGILGFGTIGSGVKDVIDSLDGYEVTKVCDMPAKKEILKDLYIDNGYSLVINRDVDYVVEAMGGDTPAYDFIKAALMNKKHVTTSNKEVVSNHLDEFVRLAKENGVQFLFEASVGGGIPLLHNVYEVTKFDTIKSIKGIMNGTTNYIITRIEEGMDFAKALKLAQDNGFAERDPSADLQGLDLVRKISILADLSFNTFVNTKDVYHYGIETISKEVIDFLSEKGMAVKLIAECKKVDSTLYMCVEPQVMPKSNVLANVKNEFNEVLIDCAFNDKLAFYGKGAGKHPTACAVVSDITNQNSKIDFNDLTFENEFEVKNHYDAKYFLYSENEIDEKYVESKEGNFYFTKTLKEEELLKIVEDVKFYGRLMED